MAEIIFGIDHGNGNMKGNNVNFPCGLVRYTSEPGRFMNEDILEYQGTFYTLSETRMPFKADKTVDEDYFILTLFALALEARAGELLYLERILYLELDFHRQILDSKLLDSRDILWNIPSMVSPLSLTENRLTVI